MNARERMDGLEKDVHRAIAYWIDEWDIAAEEVVRVLSTAAAAYADELFDDDEEDEAA